MARFYLDHNAATVLDPHVLKAMLAELSGPPGNPSSMHYFGQQARARLAHARHTTALFFDVKPEEVIFTSGGTESLNLFLRGFFGSRFKSSHQGHLITTAIEHASVYRTVQIIEGAGLDVTYIPVNSWGAPLPEKIEEAIRPQTSAILLSAANSETGVKLDIAQVARLAERHEVPFILDAVALVGKEHLPILPGMSAIACSGHQFHAPKGTGCAITRSTFKITPLITGSPQEQNRRAGTENLPGIIGFAEALRILHTNQSQITKEMAALRDHLEQTLLQELPDVTVNGEGPRVANTSNLAFGGIDGETLFMHLDMAGVAISHGSACSSGALEPSRALLQMGFDKERARSSLRFSLCRFNTREEIDAALERILEVVKKLRT